MQGRRPVARQPSARYTERSRVCLAPSRLRARAAQIVRILHTCTRHHVEGGSQSAAPRAPCVLEPTGGAGGAGGRSQAPRRGPTCAHEGRRVPGAGRQWGQQSAPGIVTCAGRSRRATARRSSPAAPPAPDGEPPGRRTPSTAHPPAFPPDLDLRRHPRVSCRHPASHPPGGVRGLSGNDNSSTAVR